MAHAIYSDSWQSQPQVEMPGALLIGGTASGKRLQVDRINLMRETDHVGRSKHTRPAHWHERRRLRT